MTISTEIEKQQFYNLQTMNSQINSENNKAGDTGCSDFKIHPKPTVIKAVQYWHRDRLIDQ